MCYKACTFDFLHAKKDCIGVRINEFPHFENVNEYKRYSYDIQAMSAFKMYIYCTNLSQNRDKVAEPQVSMIFECNIHIWGNNQLQKIVQ